MLIVCCRSLILIVLEKFSMDVPCFCCFAPSSMCTHHYFTTHACHIAPAAQVSYPCLLSSLLSILCIY
ncbi:hypothetical protein CISIN_1g034825mg [Citrus sinensis]|uniref:Secreted protein n=1 Tax=Citrus sinensis TaxID=2711 RepID=A0A067D0L4_CITSI|nr:hypothetical protein CISIN_1g034825mg [Citrus sinensis]